METVTNPTDWSQFGLAGLVIAALFAFLWYGVKAMIHQLETMTDRHEKTINSYREEHLRERSEWRSEHMEERSTLQMRLAEQAQDVKTVVKALTDAVIDLKVHKNNKDNNV